MTGYEMPTSWAEASDDFKARARLRAQAIWIKMGGPGLAPERLVFGLATEQRDAFAQAEAAASVARRKLAMACALIEEATGFEAIAFDGLTFPDVTPDTSLAVMRFLNVAWQVAELGPSGPSYAAHVLRQRAAARRGFEELKKEGDP